MVRLHARSTLARAVDGSIEQPDETLVLAAYARWGVRCVERLQGEFAFVIDDHAHGRVIAACDAQGTRPLFWGETPTAWAFGSAPSVVAALPELDRRLREESIAEFLRSGVLETRTATWHRSVHRIPAAHVLEASAGAAVLRRYWDFPVPPIRRAASDAAVIEEFDALLRDAVRDRIGDAPASILLSGGLDSTMLAATARAVSPAPLTALTVASERWAPSEDVPLAEATARHLGLPWMRIDIERFLPCADLADRRYDPAPVDEPTLAAWRAMAQAASESASIALYGEDGDTLAFGPGLWTQLRTEGVRSTASRWLAYRRTEGARPWIGLEWRRRMHRLLGGDRTLRPPWLRASVPSAPRDVPVAHPTRARAVTAFSSPMWDALYDALSPAVTRAPVLFSLPLTDPRLMAFVFSLPAVPWLQRKLLYRRAMAGRLPTAVLARPKTPLDGIDEARVAAWRALGGAHTPVSPALDRWVDRAQLAAVWRSGSVDEVVASWRVLQLDAWLAGRDS
ncbi:MAG: hypothetical protein K2X99_03810 [Gemmatimonadaceae bacterium]|nr:hypothetical protein [Gemmatimonadaceae bacterium]